MMYVQMDYKMHKTCLAQLELIILHFCTVDLLADNFRNGKVPEMKMYENWFFSASW